MIIDNIQTQLEQKALERFPNLSQSDAAEWKFWTSIMALAVKAVQWVADSFKADIDKKLSYLRPGTIGWYAQVAKQFQFGHNLVVKQDGSLGYIQSEEESQIIAAASVVERSGGAVIVKVAKDVNDTLVGLDSIEMQAFQNYMETVKFVGTRLSVITQNADTIKYSLKVHHSPAYDPQDLTTAINEAINYYKLNLGFSAVVYPQRFVQCVLDVEGVVTAELHVFDIKNALSSDWVPINVKQELYAGYFNYDNDSEIILESVTNANWL